MRTAAISILKAKLSEHIDWVKGGEEVIVTDRGKPVAKIIPVISKNLDDRLQVLIGNGAINPPKEKIDTNFLNDLPILVLSQAKVLEIIDAERGIE